MWNPSLTEVASMEEKKFWWSPENVQMLLDRYEIDGPKRLAEVLGTTPISVSLKARRLGLTKKVHSAYEWTEEMLATLREIYATADKKTLLEKIPLPLYVIRGKARNLGLRNDMRASYSAATRRNNNVTSDIHFFDQWTEHSAYALGFLFADGAISSRGADVVAGISIKDVAILDYLKKQMKSTRDYYYREGDAIKDGYKRSKTAFFTISSKYVVERLMEMGLMPRKTYRDDPFPEVPNEMLPHFIRGYFDGDGTAFVSSQGHCKIGMIGTPKFITGLRDHLVAQADMKESPVKMEPRPKTGYNARIFWGSTTDIRKFRDYVYPEGFTFCLERKKKVMDDWLSVPHVVHAPAKVFTKEEEDFVRTWYYKMGPSKVGEFLGRRQSAITKKAQQLGLGKYHDNKPKHRPSDEEE